MSKLAKLLLIDPQEDFVDNPLPVRGRNFVLTPEPALPVPGAYADMLRIADFIERAGGLLNRIVVTMDSHPYVGIERTTFWVDAQGKEVQPLTAITDVDVMEGRFSPRNAEHIDPVSGQTLRARVVSLLQQLKAAGRPELIVWPVHCVTGTWGANIHSVVQPALAAWERQALHPVRKVSKGEYHLAEHYGVFEAETPIWEVPSTRFNAALADELRCDALFIAGEASSHCVAASVDQLLRYRKGIGAGIYLLTDCMSPVPGFTQLEQDFFNRAQAAGVTLCTAADALGML